MKIFTDSTGRDWNISLTLGAAKRVFDIIGVNLLDPASISSDADKPEKTTSGRLLNDALFVGEVVSCLIGKQARDRGLAPDETLDIFDGATIGRAQTAFLEEYRYFFTAQKNKAGTQFVDAMIDAVKQIKEGTATLEETTIETNAEDAPAELAGETSIDAPVEQESSDSTI